MKNVSLAQKLGVVAVCAVLLAGTVGCTQAQVQNAINVIEAELPTAVSIATEVMTIVSAFSSTTDGAYMWTGGAKLQSDIADLETLLNKYKVGASTWPDIVAAVDTLAGDGDQALLDLTQIKDANSRARVQTVLASLDAVIHIIDGAVQATQTQAQVKATAEKRAIKLKSVAVYWSESDKKQMSAVLGHSYSLLYSTAVAEGF